MIIVCTIKYIDVYLTIVLWSAVADVVPLRCLGVVVRLYGCRKKALLSSGMRSLHTRMLLCRVLCLPCFLLCSSDLCDSCAVSTSDCKKILTRYSWCSESVDSTHQNFTVTSIYLLQHPRSQHSTMNMAALESQRMRGGCSALQAPHPHSQ